MDNPGKTFFYLRLYMCDFIVGHNSRSGNARSKADFLTRNIINMN